MGQYTREVWKDGPGEYLFRGVAGKKKQASLSPTVLSVLSPPGWTLECEGRGADDGELSRGRDRRTSVLGNPIDRSWRCLVPQHLCEHTEDFTRESHNRVRPPGEVCSTQVVRGDMPRCAGRQRPVTAGHFTAESSLCIRGSWLPSGNTGLQGQLAPPLVVIGDPQANQHQHSQGELEVGKQG